MLFVKTMAFLVLFCLLSLPIDVLPQVRSDIAECTVDQQVQPYYTLFLLDGQPLQAMSIETVVLEENENNCTINTTNLVSKMALPRNPIEMVVSFYCKRQLDIHFLPYDGEQYKHVVFHVEIFNCTTDIAQLDYLLDVADTRILGLMFCVIKNSMIKTNNTYRGLQSVVAFTLENRLDQDQSWFDIFNVNESYPQLVEITLGNMSITKIPDEFAQMFPNLQSLELPNNKLLLPPDMFPWISSTVYLPRNISRTPLMQSHYSLFDHVNIPANIFRRYLTLDKNNIVDLSDFSFHGLIDKISLRGNELQLLGNDTFKNVLALQNLDLSNNKIRELPGKVFRGLTVLKKLDLGANNIQSLPSGIFDDLSSLTILNLANNSLAVIGAGMFTRLYQLQHLRLEHNFLHKVSAESFPLDTINLKEIHFQFNPIDELPNFPFWIRGLKLANFQSTNISFDNFTNFLENIDISKVLHSVVDSASSTDLSDLLKRAAVLTKIDLTNSSVSHLTLAGSLPKVLNVTLLVVLLHFEFVLKDNPIMCDCNINNISDFINARVENGTISRDEYFFKDWICRSPIELEGRKMLKIIPSETYCPVEVTDCPKECVCYKRATIDNIIVDCRDKDLQEMHLHLPSGAKLELWYGGNNITKLLQVPNAENVVYLDISFNKIEVINEDVLRQMTSLKDVHMQSNVLAYLPVVIDSLNLTNVTIWPNPLTCDCKSLWTKRWLENKRRIINNWQAVSCKVEHEEGMLITEVADEKFVCHESDFDETKHVILPAIVCSTIVVIMLIGAFVFYTYRLECKVLLFVYFGVHPFDKDANNEHENLDCVVVHSGNETDWVMEQIVSLLENESYRFVVCDMARDFVVGFSFQENLTRTVRHSKRMIFCLSQTWNTTSESFTIAWRIAQEKIKQTRSHYGIIVSHNVKLQDIKDKDLRRFIKRGRFVDSSDKLFTSKVIYYMPEIVSPSNGEKEKLDNTFLVRKHSDYISRCFINSYCDDDANNLDISSATEDDVFEQASCRKQKSHAFISYHETDIQYVLKELIPILEEKGFTYCIADRDFVPGASIEENVLNAIGSCHRTIFILTPAHVQDEWSLFTFRTAYEKALREKSNYLLVIIKEDLKDMNVDEEIKHYLKNYICLKASDQWFQKKLFNGLPLLKNKEELHSSPLFINNDEIEITLHDD